MADLTKDSTAKHLWSLAVPMYFGIFAIISFNLLDTYFVSKLGITALAAMSFSIPTTLTLIHFNLGLGSGLTSVMSVSIGQKDFVKARQQCTSSLIFVTILVAILIAIGMPFLPKFFTWLGASSEALPMLLDYMEIWLLGLPVLVIPMLGNSAIRATGDTKFPAMIMILAAIANGLLDPLLIFGTPWTPRLELKGAALASLLSRVPVLIASLYILRKREKLLSLKGLSLSIFIKRNLEVLKVAAPISLSNVVVPFASTLVTKQIAVFGLSATAAWAVICRIEAFSLVALMALSSALSPFIGQNLGAKKYNRVKEAIKIACGISFIYSLVIIVLLYLLAPWLGSFFSTQQSVLKECERYFKFVPLSYSFLGFFFIGISYYNVSGKSLQASLISSTRALGFYVCLAIVLSKYFETMGIYAAHALANIFGTILLISHIYYSRKSEKALFSN